MVNKCVLKESDLAMDILDFIRDLKENDRRTLLQILMVQYCSYCGRVRPECICHTDKRIIKYQPNIFVDIKESV